MIIIFDCMYEEGFFKTCLLFNCIKPYLELLSITHNAAPMTESDTANAIPVVAHM